MRQQNWPTPHYLLRLFHLYLAAAIAAGVLFVTIAFVLTVPAAAIPQLCVAILVGIAIGIAIGWPLERYFRWRRDNTISNEHS
jgi:hypothetical protein